MGTALVIHVWEGNRYGRDPKYTIEISDSDLYSVSKLVSAIEKIGESLSQIAAQGSKKED